MRPQLVLYVLTLHVILGIASRTRASDETFITIDFPGARLTGARGINVRGDIVGDYDDVDGVTHGYVLQRGNFSSFDFPDSIHTRLGH